jgi:hypothetical protein
VTLRKKLLQELSETHLTPFDDISSNEYLCLSLAWDWTYRGYTSDGINNELSSMMECAALNRDRSLQSLAIPETSILFTARAFLAIAEKSTSLSTTSYKNCNLVSPEPISVLRGILPSLSRVVAAHKVAAKSCKLSTTLRTVPLPDSSQNPSQATIDPYGSDYFCKICNYELSNIYLHCYGCEMLLQKDFNICCRYVHRFHKLYFIFVMQAMYSCNVKLIFIMPKMSVNCFL